MSSSKTKSTLNKILDNLERIPPLPGIAIFFILGILSAAFVNIPFFIWLGFCLLAFTIAFLRRKRDFIFSLAFLLFCSSLGALHIRNHLRLPQNHIAFLSAKSLNDIRISGIVDSDPAYSERKVSFVFKTKKIITPQGPQKIEGEILANVFAKEKFSYGNELILEGNFYRPFDFETKTNFSYRDYLRNQGIYNILNVKKENEIVLLNKEKGNFLKGMAFKIKHTFKESFARYLWPINARVLSGIILGERQNFPDGIRQAFVQTGTSHIIAISGFNVGLVAFMVLILLKALGIKRKLRYCLSIPILILHSLAVGGQSSVARATIMAVIVLIAYLIEREAHIINSLSLAALIILGYNPMQIFDIGFQLSFVSVLGIVLLSPKIAKAVQEIFLKRKPVDLLRFTINGFSVSLSAWLVTFGFVAYYFRIISPITIIANLIIVPWTSLVIILGFSLGLSSQIFPALAPSIAATTNFALGLLFKLTFGLSRLPFAYFYF